MSNVNYPTNLENTLIKIMLPTKELAHGQETKKWLLEISPNTDWQVQIAALAHDIERAVPHIKGETPLALNKDNFATYDEFKQAHALRSAQIVKNIMLKQGFSNEDIKRVVSAIEKHEAGGDPDSDLVRDADSIRWFDVGYPGYVKKYGLGSAKEKGWWMYKRASQKTKEIIMQFDFEYEIKDYIKEYESAIV